MKLLLAASLLGLAVAYIGKRADDYCQRCLEGEKMRKMTDFEQDGEVEVDQDCEYEGIEEFGPCGQ